MRDEFYGTMDDELHKRGMKAYSEASGVALEIPEDTLLNKSHVDIPMAEFWVHALHPESMYYVDVRGAASAAHVYGKPHRGDGSLYRRRVRVAVHAEEDCGLLVCAGRQSPGLPHLGPAAAGYASPATRWWARTSTATSPGRSRRSRS